MIKIIKEIEIKGKKGKMISKALSEVIEEFRTRAEIKKLKKLRVIVTENPVEVCKKIIHPVKLRRHSEMREWVCENMPTFSYLGDGEPHTIMIDANERIFKGRHYEAVKGLFAHELMHLMNKLDRIEDELEGKAEEAGKEMFRHLAKHKEVKPFTRERLLSSFIRVTTTGLLFIKDILANTRAMSFGFDDELYENYKISLAGVKEEIEYTEKGVVKALKRDQKHVLDNAFLFYLGLNIPWITFKMFHNKMFEELQEMAKVKVPRVVKKEADAIIEEMLKLRSASDEEQIDKILTLMQKNYFKLVKHYCKKLR